MTTVILNVMRQLDQQLDDGVTLVVFVRRCGCPALNLGRRYWGNDIASESLAIARERLIGGEPAMDSR